MFYGLDIWFQHVGVRERLELDCHLEILLLICSHSSTDKCFVSNCDDVLERWVDEIGRIPGFKW